MRACLPVALVLLGCGGQGSPLILVDLTGVPAQTATLRATSYLDEKPEQDPAIFPADQVQFVIRLPPGSAGRYRLEVEALASDGCSFAVATGETDLTGQQRVDLTIPFSAPLPFRTCALIVTKAGAGPGYVESAPGSIYCGDVPAGQSTEPATCAGQFEQGITVTLTATPKSTALFDHWSGACTGTAPCRVVMSGPATVTATFAAKLP